MIVAKTNFGFMAKNYNEKSQQKITFWVRTVSFTAFLGHFQVHRECFCSFFRNDEILEKKNKALKLKEKGNDAFKRKKYVVAEKFYSEALQLNPGSRPIWTNRAICRNTMKNHEDALADCLSALSIDSKFKKAGF